jgi:hypothetical protein
VDVPDSTDFQLVALTIEGWIYPQEWGGVVFWRGNSQVDAFKLDLSLAGNVALRCNTATNGPAVLLTPIELSQWQHIAGTLDGTTGDMKLYLNGVLATQTNAALRPLVQFISRLQTGVAIGNQGSVYLNLASNGLADEISLYGRALSQSEVQAIYNAGAAGKCLPLLLPLILSQPTNLTVTAGSTARFSVEARSDWPLSYHEGIRPHPPQRILRPRYLGSYGMGGRTIFPASGCFITWYRFQHFAQKSSWSGCSVG